MNLKCILCNNKLDVLANEITYQHFLCQSCKFVIGFNKTKWSDRALTHVWILNDNCKTNEYKYLFYREQHEFSIYEQNNPIPLYTQNCQNLNDRDMFLFAFKLMNNLIFV